MMSMWAQVLDKFSSKELKWIKGKWGLKTKVESVCVMGALGLLVHGDRSHFEKSLQEEGPLTPRERKELLAFAKVVMEQYPEFTEHWMQTEEYYDYLGLDDDDIDNLPLPVSKILRRLRLKMYEPNLIGFIVEFNDWKKTKEADIIRVLEKTTLQLAEEV